MIRVRIAEHAARSRRTIRWYVVLRRDQRWVQNYESSSVAVEGCTDGIPAGVRVELGGWYGGNINQALELKLVDAVRGRAPTNRLDGLSCDIYKRIWMCL